MIKFKVAKNPSFFDQNRKEDFKTFYSKPKMLRVKELPPHPLRDAVAVGNYRLEEALATDKPATGQSVAYEFNIYGEGNISAVEKPLVLNDGNFDIYEPNVKQNVNRENGRVTGSKSFSYFIIPKEPGTYAMKDYFKWVFFNPTIKRYDTLQSKQVLTVSGESQKNMAIESNDTGAFYERMAIADNTLRASTKHDWLKTAINIFIVVVLAASVFLLVRKR